MIENLLLNRDLTRDEALEFLRSIKGEKEKIEEWNNYRDLHSNWKPELSDHINKTNLSGIILSFKDENGIWIGVNLKDANLFGVNLKSANLRSVNLYGANLSHAILDKAELKYSNLSFVNFRDASIKEVSLYMANINGADLRGADLTSAHIFSIEYDRSSMLGKYLGVRGLDSCFGDAYFKRDAQDQDFIDTVEIHLKNKWQRSAFNLWKFFDFGRSIGRAILVAFIAAITFGLIYWFDWFFTFGLLRYGSSANSWLTPFYYSIVTYSTLGFGDVTPQHWIGEMIVIIEVIFGYLTLGLLVSILANKVARRS